MNPEQNLEGLKKEFLAAMSRQDVIVAKTYLDLIRGGWLVLRYYNDALAERYGSEISAMADAIEYLLQEIGGNAQETK